MEMCNSTVGTMVVGVGEVGVGVSQGAGEVLQVHHQLNHVHQPRVKRKRAGKPKVKTGCAVCKIRRVKCGEERPECKRCVKFGMKCEGYPKQTIQPRQLQRALLPRVEQSLAVAASHTAAPSVRIPRVHAPSRREKAIRPSPPVPLIVPKMEIIANPYMPRFQSKAEYRYFALFHGQTALHLSGLYTPNVWSHIVLQASEAEASIRHAVISIGALEMTSACLKDVRTYVRAFSNAGHSDDARQQVIKCQTEQHHVFALQQYSKAIREMQKLVSGSVRDCRTALIASLLIICFETYHGNYESAAKQITTGVRLIESRHQMESSPPPIEEELLHAFTRLAIQTMGHSDPFTLDEHLVLKDSSSDLMSRMPTTFTSSLDARNYFNIIARRVMHFGCAIWQSSQPISPSSSSSIPAKPTLSHFEHISSLSPTLLAEKNRYLAEIEAWHRAFQPMFDNAVPGTNEYLASRTMRLHYLPVHLTTMLFPSTSEMAYDNYLDLFKEVIDLAKLQLNASSREPMFAFDLQNVWPLFLAAKKCRDPTVRRECIRLLSEWPRREGIWDSVVAAKVSRWVVEIEEEGMVGGFVEEGRRTTSVEVRLDFEGGRAEVWCLVAGGRRRETVIEWVVQG